MHLSAVTPTILILLLTLRNEFNAGTVVTFDKSYENSIFIKGSFQGCRPVRLENIGGYFTENALPSIIILSDQLLEDLCKGTRRLRP